MKFFEWLFGKGEKKQEADNNSEKTKSIADYFAQAETTREVVRAFDADEKSPAELIRENFQRSIFDVKYSTVDYDAEGNRIEGKGYAFDASEDGEGIKLADGGCDRSTFVRAITPQQNDIINDTVWAHYSNDSYIGWSACAVLAQNPVIHLACYIPADDAMSSGYELSFADEKSADIDDDGNRDDDALLRLKKETENLGINKACVKLEYNKRVFGSGIAFPIIYNEDGTHFDMSKPFNADGLKGKRYKGYRVVDPYWLSPQFDRAATQDPTSPMFMKPTWYKLPDGRLVHYSWYVKVDNAEVADILKPTYYYGGMPLTQMIYKRVWCAEKTANEAPLLAMSKRMLIVDANVQQIVKNKNYVFNLMKVITKCRNNWGVFFKSPTSNIQQIDTSLAEFEACMFSQYQLVASIAQMPATKLLQTTPKGFNSTGEFEWKVYAQLLQTIQDSDYKPLIEKHLSILTATEGKARTLSVIFAPIDAPSERDKAEIESMKASTRSNYVQNGIVTADEVRDILRNDEDGEFSGIPRDNEELNDSNEEEFGSADEGESEEAKSVKVKMVKKQLGKLNRVKDAMDEFAEDETWNDNFKEEDHPRDADGKFTSKAGAGVKQQLNEYKKTKGVQKGEKGNRPTLSPKEQAKSDEKVKKFEFPQKTMEEVYEGRLLSKKMGNRYNGGKREYDKGFIKDCTDLLDRIGGVRNDEKNVKFDDLKKKDIVKRGKKIEGSKDGQAQFEWFYEDQKTGKPIRMSDDDAFVFEKGLANGGYYDALDERNKGLMVRKDFATAFGQIIRYKNGGTQKTSLSKVAEWEDKRRHTAEVDAMFNKASDIYDIITSHSAGKFDAHGEFLDDKENVIPTDLLSEFGTLAYLQYRTTFRIGSKTDAKNLGALDLTTENIKLGDGNTITFSFDAKNGHWTTTIEDERLYNHFKKVLKERKQGERLFSDKCNYQKYLQYMKSIGKKLNITLGSHDMRRLAASTYASQLVDKIKVPVKDEDEYINAIADVVDKVKYFINDKDPAMGFRSYIAPEALWHNAREIYAKNKRLEPSNN